MHLWENKNIVSRHISSAKVRSGTIDVTPYFFESSISVDGTAHQAS